MSLKETIMTWAEDKEIDIKDWQKTNFGRIEREYTNSNGEVGEDDVIEKFSDELKKTGKYLSDSEKRDLKSKLF